MTTAGFPWINIPMIADAGEQQAFVQRREELAVLYRGMGGSRQLGARRPHGNPPQVCRAWFSRGRKVGADLGSAAAFAGISHPRWPDQHRWVTGARGSRAAG